MMRYLFSPFFNRFDALSIGWLLYALGDGVDWRIIGISLLVVTIFSVVMEKRVK